VTLVNLNQLYLRASSRKDRSVKSKVGQQGAVYLDSFPEQPL